MCRCSRRFRYWHNWNVGTHRTYNLTQSRLDGSGWWNCCCGISGLNRQVIAKEKTQDEFEETNHNYQRVIEEEKRNHQAEISRLNQEIDRLCDLKTPNLIFHVETVMRMGTICDIHLEVENSGLLPCRIFGCAKLESFVYRDQKPAYKLDGLEIAGKGQRRVTLTVKRVLLISAGDPAIQPARLHCTVSYDVLQGSKSQIADFVYVPSKRLFERVI